MNPKTYTWKTARTVKESGLAEFGSSRDDDSESPPAATLTFEVLWFLPDFNTLALTLNTRSGVKAARQLFAMVDAKPTNPFFQRYKICSVRNVGPTNETYYGYRYRGDGFSSTRRSQRSPSRCSRPGRTSPSRRPTRNRKSTAAPRRTSTEPPLDHATLTPTAARFRCRDPDLSEVIDDDVPF